MQNRDAVFRRKWAEFPVQEIVPAAAKMLRKYAGGVTDAHVEAYAKAVSLGARVDFFP